MLIIFGVGHCWHDVVAYQTVARVGAQPAQEHTAFNLTCARPGGRFASVFRMYWDMQSFWLERQHSQHMTSALGHH